MPDAEYLDDLDTPYPVDVILRRTRSGYFKGDLIALFPFEFTGDSPDKILAFINVGQHTDASYWRVICDTVSVNKNDVDAQELLRKLEQGYKYVITLRRKRMSSTARAKFREHQKAQRKIMEGANNANDS